MPCYQMPIYGGVTGSGTAAGAGYATEAECIQACQEGACCNGTSCFVLPRCQCEFTFLGVGITCTPNPCNPLP